MADIEFVRNYGYAPPAPFWLVWNENGQAPRFKHPNLAAAEGEAARLAQENPGSSFHVLGVLATVATSDKVVGTRFDPMKDPPAPTADIPEAPLAEPPIAPAFLAELADGDDGKPF